MRFPFLACLSLGLLSNFTTHAQWVTQPIGFTANTAPVQLSVIDASTVWTVGTGGSSTYTPPQVARTVNAGQTWTVATPPVRTALQEEVTALTAVSATTAWLTTTTHNVAGGRILRTTDGGQNWTIQSSTSVYVNANSSPTLIHFFSATEGLTFGVPLTPTGSLEIYRTTNAGLTWTPVTGGPSLLMGESLGANAPAIVGNNIWYLTDGGRVLRSADKGLTWTAANAIGGFSTAGSLAFRDAQNGLLSVADDKSTNHELYRTTDAGSTWTRITYTGPLHGLALCSVPGSALYVSAGANIGNGDQGSSYSTTNGQTWVPLENSLNHITVKFLGRTSGWSGGFTFSSSQLTGTANRFTSTVLGTRTEATLQASLSVAPNPALGGRCSLYAGEPGEATTVRVLDSTGRLIQQYNWSGHTSLPLDLSQQPKGLYVVEVQSPSGSARKKVVVE